MGLLIEAISPECLNNQDISVDYRERMMHIPNKTHNDTIESKVLHFHPKWKSRQS